MDSYAIIRIRYRVVFSVLLHRQMPGFRCSAAANAGRSVPSCLKRDGPGHYVIHSPFGLSSGIPFCPYTLQWQGLQILSIIINTAAPDL